MDSKLVRRADALLWVGNEALHIWDAREESESCIRLLGREGDWIPYVPAFYDIWEDSPRYQRELGDILGSRRLWGKRRVLVCAPEDLTAIEAIALEDFLYAAMGGGLKRRGGVVVRTQSQLLQKPGRRSIAVTRSCRCYTVAVVEDGQVAEKVMLDVNDCTRDILLRQIRDYHSRYRDSAMEVCYPQIDADLLIDGIGGEISLSRMAEIWLD